MCNIKRVKRFLHIHTIIELPSTGGFKCLGKGPHKNVVCLHFFPLTPFHIQDPNLENSCAKKKGKKKKENQHSEVTKYIFECKCWTTFTCGCKSESYVNLEICWFHLVFLPFHAQHVLLFWQQFDIFRGTHLQLSESQQWRQGRFYLRSCQFLAFLSAAAQDWAWVMRQSRVLTIK